MARAVSVPFFCVRLASFVGKKADQLYCATLRVPLCPSMNENTDLETLVLSNSTRFWELFDKASAGKRTPMEELPDPDDDKAWKKLAR